MGKLWIMRIINCRKRNKNIRRIGLLYFKANKTKKIAKIKVIAFQVLKMKQTKKTSKKHNSRKYLLPIIECKVAEDPPIEINQPEIISNSILKINHQKIEETILKTQSIHQLNIGLKNIGNTCYMNSVLQCLFKTYQLQKYKLEYCELRYQYQLLCKAVMRNQSPQDHLNNIKVFVANENSVFLGSSQNDASQWFTTFISILHNSMGVKQSPIYKINEQMRKQINSVKLWRQYKLKDQSRCRSFIDDIFFSRHQTIYECQKCKFTYVLFQKFLCLYLPIPIKKEKLTLPDCYQQFASTEILKNQNRLYCKKCQTEQITSKRMFIYQTNTILVFCLKRFTEKSKMYQPILIPFTITIHSRIDSLNLNVDTINDVAQKDRREKRRSYHLYAFINHHGSLNFGHYTATCYDNKLNQWIRFSDSHLQKLTQDELLRQSQNAYLLFYRLQEKNDQNV